MINRTLIRLKVVQALYAHLISRTDFHVYMAPLRNTMEARQSYGIYCRALALILIAGGQRHTPAGQSAAIHFPADKLIKALGADPEVKECLAANLPEMEERLQGLTVPFKEAIENSTIYKDYMRKRIVTIEDNILFWEVVLKTILLPMMVAYYPDRNEYSGKAIDNGIDMAIDTLKNYVSVRVSYNQAKKSLSESLEKAYDLYISLLVLAVDLTKERERQLDNAKNKYLPTYSELNPDTRFVDNRLVKAIENNEAIENYRKNHTIDWESEPGFLRTMLSVILSSQIYKDYMDRRDTDFADDCEFWKKIFQDVIFPSDELAEALESKSIYWNDDLHIIGTFVIKTIRSAAKSADSEEPLRILPMYKDEEDREFGARLFVDTADHQDEYREYIDRFIKSGWELERIAFMDIVIITTAISELVNFPAIPLPVTMNEYTEIAADYSAGQSVKFVNGILFSVSQELKKEGKIMK